MQEDPRETIQRLAALAGVPLSDERAAAAATAMPLVTAVAQALAAADPGEAEPAARFQPPRGETR